jgi:hypothetical protein
LADVPPEIEDVTEHHHAVVLFTGHFNAKQPATDVLAWHAAAGEFRSSRDRRGGLLGLTPNPEAALRRYIDSGVEAVRDCEAPSLPLPLTETP